jgi:hypothetical protein
VMCYERTFILDRRISPKHIGHGWQDA